MTSSPEDPAAVLRGRRLRQPDQRSCGAACLVVARLVLEPGYAGRVVTEQQWRRAVLDMHRRVTGPVDAHGAAQLPWPRPLGTPPWAMARQLSATSGVANRARQLRTQLVVRRESSFDRLAEAVQEVPAALYVGNWLLPRHVVLAVAATPQVVTCYEPSQGVTTDVYRQDFVSGRLGLADWDRPWFLVVAERAG